MYSQPLGEFLVKRTNKQVSTPERKQENQRAYYQRRGWFSNRKRHLLKKLNLSVADYKHITNVEEMDDFSRQYLLEHYKLNIKDHPSIFLLRCIHIPQPNLP
jgi:hypothetical protein